jgi:integrase
MTIGRVEKLTPAQARDKAKEIVADATLGDDPVKKRKAELAYDLRTYIEQEYQPWVKTNHRDPKETIRKIKVAFPTLLDKKLTEITRWYIEKIRSARIENGTKPATVNRDISALRGALSRAVEWGFLESNPLDGLKAFQVDSSAKVRYLSSKEQEALLEALDEREEEMRQHRERANEWRRERGYEQLRDLRVVPFADRLKPLVLTSLHTGIRRGEAFNLKWPDIDLSLAVMTVAGGGTKTITTRHVPLNSEALQVLKDWKSQTSDTGSYVFPSNKGGRLNNIKTSWSGLLKRAGITSFRWHDLRHTFASKLVMKGVDLNTVRELMGHTDMKMTLRYAHLAPEVKAAAVEKLTQGGV